MDISERKFTFTGVNGQNDITTGAYADPTGTPGSSGTSGKDGYTPVEGTDYNSGSSGTSGSTMSLPVGTTVAALSDWLANHANVAGATKNRLIKSDGYPGNADYVMVGDPAGVGNYILKATRSSNGAISIVWQEWTGGFSGS